MTEATSVLVITAWLAAVGFIGRYLLTTWYKRAAGRLTMALVASAFGVLSLAALTTVLGRDWPLREPVRFLVYLVLNGLLWAGLVTLVRDQRRGRTMKAQPTKETP